MSNATLISEAQFQATVRAYAEAKGWKVWTSWKSFHSPAGEVDLRLCRPPRVLFVELKSAKGKLTPMQAETQELLKACPGVEYHCFRPADWPAIERVLE